ncbi:Zinc finger HIT domain-containing protein 1 [Goodea atripinnis]|uniref:Zinc finger HIT domain-containing protein 1 n=1 Tax=Goodea atripinnis TaxID=208336 RepID=A0ABV0NDM7_9TELE
MVLEKKSSARVEAGQRRVLDEATRQRRLTRQLEALEKDNFQDDPLSSLPPPGPTAQKKKRKTRGDHFKQRFRKNFTTLLEEENLSERPEPNYLSVVAPPSSLPPRHFCCVCGFPSHYTCTTCGGRYCSSKCLITHRETRTVSGARRRNKNISELENWTETVVLGCSAGIDGGMLGDQKKFGFCGGLMVSPVLFKADKDLLSLVCLCRCLKWTL